MLKDFNSIFFKDEAIKKKNQKIRLMCGRLRNCLNETVLSIKKTTNLDTRMKQEVHLIMFGTKILI